MKRLIPLMLALVGCGATVSLADPTPTLFVLPTAPPTGTDAPVPTDAPTDTPIPTSTDTPRPTVTPVPTTDPALVVYANKRDDTAYYLRDVKADIDPTFGKFIEGRVSVNDAAWQAEVELYFHEFDVGVEEIEKLIPPAPFAESHRLTMLGVQACSDGFWNLYLGALLNDQAVYQVGVTNIADCNRDWGAGDYAYWDVVLQHGLEWPAMSQPTLAP